MEQGSVSEGGSESDGANVFRSCFSTKSAREHMESFNKGTEKVHYILKSLYIPTFHYIDELELLDNIFELGGSLKYNRLKVSVLNYNLSRCKFKYKEKMHKNKKLEL